MHRQLSFYTTSKSYLMFQLVKEQTKYFHKIQASEIFINKDTFCDFTMSKIDNILHIFRII